MKASTAEFQPGLVLWIDQKMLMDDPTVDESFAQRYGTMRPFVCVDVVGNRSTWTPLTGQHRVERLRIEREWRSGGELPWRVGETYLNDGANTYTGPSTAFVAANSKERTVPSKRARISDQGLAAVRAEIERQRHRRQRHAS